MQEGSCCKKAQRDAWSLYVSARLLLQSRGENIVRKCKQATLIPEYCLPPERAFHSSCSKWIRKKSDAMFKRV